MAREGDIIGESAMIQDLVYTYSAITMGNVELVEVTNFSFKQVFQKAPPWILDLTTTMISRFQSISNLIAENRLIHSSIVEEDRYTSEVEIEYKRLLSQ
jgi:CRP-like cAMP-binding protein